MTKEEAAHLSEVLKAYSEGKSIQRLNTSVMGAEWEDVSYIDVALYPTIQYRVKKEPRLRPYANAEEFLKAQKEHGPYLEKIGEFYLPTSVRHDAVLWGFCTKWKDLLNYYKWQDGTPCGILEE